MDRRREHRFRATFPVLLLILVHFLTIGLASPFLVARKYAFLPTIERGDFSTARAAGFLFIPFFGLYWIFVLCRRLTDRLGHQAYLWRTGDAPSKDLATAVALGCVLGPIGWAFIPIPYVGLIIWLLLNFCFWPLYLTQVQRTCNRLALAAAPPEARSLMVALERATRLRWLGWVMLAPGLLMSANALVLAVTEVMTAVQIRPWNVAVMAVITGAGAVLRFLGGRGTGALQDRLAQIAPANVAGYLRIDKNAAWTMAWIAAGFGLYYLWAGLTEPQSVKDGLQALSLPAGLSWMFILLGAELIAASAFAVLRALQLKREIARLNTMPPSLNAESLASLSPELGAPRHL